jgi:hypothetical protein
VRTALHWQLIINDPRNLGTFAQADAPQFSKALGSPDWTFTCRCNYW